MRRDPTKFRERFKRWKNGERVYDKGTPVTQPQDKMDSLLDAGYQGPWGTYGYTTDDVSRRIQQRTQARNNHIADRLQAGADAIMLGMGLVPGGQIPSSTYFGARGVGNIAQGDYIGGAIDAGLSLVGPAVHLNRQMHKPSNLKSYFESNPLALHKYDLSQLPEGELLTRFWNEDVVPRMKKALKDDGTIKTSGVNKLFNNDFVRTRRIRIGEAPTNLRGKGYSSGTNDIAFNTNSNLWKDPDLRYGALAHELHHSQRANLDRNKLLYAGQSGEYTQAEQDALNDAYNFSDEFITKYSPSQLQEKGAVNTQTRAAISRMNGGVVGKQLNKAIDAMPEKSIKKIISDSSAYGKDFVKSSKFDIKKVNKALKQVGQIKLRPLLLAEDGKDPGDTIRAYQNTMRRVAHQNANTWQMDPYSAYIHAMSDPTYNYFGYYLKYPESKANSESHWPDEFKTSQHPTFSTESRYSGKIDKQYNPYGLRGGTWSKGPMEHLVPSTSDKYFKMLIGYEDGKDPTYNTRQSHLPEVTISAKRTNYTPTYGYWDSLGQQWSTFNNLGQREYRGAGWEPDVVLKTPQEYENYRQALWKKADPNKTFEFSDLIRGIADTALWATAPADAISELAGKYIINPLFNTTRAAIISRAINKAVRNFDDTTKYTTHVKPQIRTKIGDIEIDNPNLLYHTDWGDGVGAMSKINESLGSPTHGGPIIKDGIIYPGAPYVEGQKGYTWWSLGKRWNNPGAGSRLTVAVKDHPDIVPVRSLKEPAGQWNGKSGFVTNSEYVASKGIDVSEGTYIFEPNYGYKKVLKDIPNRTINFYNVGNTPQTNALADFSYKGSSLIDTNSLFSDLRKRAFNDYVTGIIDNISERLRFEDLPPFETYLRPITESAQEIFNNSTLKRFARNRAAVEGVPEQFWLKGAENALPKEYYMVPRKVFNGLGEDPKIQGLHFTKSDKILVPNDFSGFDLDEILNHEMRHSLDANYDLLPEESKTLSEAYDDLFTPEIQDGAHHPKAEMTTTNRDARLQLIGPLHSAKTDPTLQNKMIDKMSDEAVMKALYDANGYGKNATRHLGLLDSEGYIDLDKVQKYVNSAEGRLRVRNIRAAMKYVPAILLGMPAYKYTQNKTAKQIKQQ